MHIDVHLCMHICTHMPRQKWALMHYMLLVYILSGWCILVAVVLKMPGSFNQYKKVVISVDLMICNLFPRYYWFFIFLSAIPVHSYYWCSFRCLWEASCYAALHGRYDIFRMKKEICKQETFSHPLFCPLIFLYLWTAMSTYNQWTLEKDNRHIPCCALLLYLILLCFIAS